MFDPELLRRLREFQAHVRDSSDLASTQASLNPLSQHETEILGRLRVHSPALAKSLEQALRDVKDGTRLTYIAPAGEAREVMRGAVQLFAPDDEVRKQPWFKGHDRGSTVNPTQAERIRYAVQLRGGNKDQVIATDGLIESQLGKIGREIYTSGSKAFHTGVVRTDVAKLIRWILVLLDEILPE